MSIQSCRRLLFYRSLCSKSHLKAAAAGGLTGGNHSFRCWLNRLCLFLYVSGGVVGVIDTCRYRFAAVELNFLIFIMGHHKQTLRPNNHTERQSPVILLPDQFVFFGTFSRIWWSCDLWTFCNFSQFVVSYLGLFYIQLSVYLKSINRRLRTEWNQN